MAKSLRYVFFLSSLMGFFLVIPSITHSPALAQKKSPPSAAKPPSSNQKPTANPKPTTPATGAATTNETDPNDLRPLSQGDTIFSLQGGERLMNEAETAINNGQYDIAIDKLQQARKIFNQLSNFHLQVANSFSGIDTAIFESQRSDALKTGQRRDEATYQLALVHRAQNKPELAVPLLIQVIRSQNPTTEFGRKAYQQLYELGFVAVPFNSTAPTTTPVPPTTVPVPPTPDVPMPTVPNPAPKP